MYIGTVVKKKGERKEKKIMVERLKDVRREKIA
jgi:hypothetical protein